MERDYLYEHFRRARNYATRGDFFIMECVLESAYLEGCKRGDDVQQEIDFFRKTVYEIGVEERGKEKGLGKKIN